MIFKKYFQQFKEISTGRKISIVLAAFVLLLGGLAGGAYLYLTIPDAEIQKELEESFGADFFELFSLDYDLQRTAENEQSGNEAGSKAPPGPGAPAEDSAGNEEKTGDDSQQRDDSERENEERDPGDSGTREVTRDKIVGRYESWILSLEEIALERLETLRKSALEEYQEQREKKGRVDRARLARKYIQAADRLEDNVDKKFQEILGEMERELREHGFSTDIIPDLEKAYKQKKAEMREYYLELGF